MAAGDELVLELLTVRDLGVDGLRFRKVDLPTLAAIGDKLGIVGELHTVVERLLDDVAATFESADRSKSARIYFGLEATYRKKSSQDRRIEAAGTYANRAFSHFRAAGGEEQALLEDFAKVLRAKRAPEASAVLTMGALTAARRPALLAEIEARLATHRVVVVHGIAGSGRATLARMAAHDYEPQAVIDLDGSSVLSFFADSARAITSVIGERTVGLTGGVTELAYRTLRWVHDLPAFTPFIVIRNLNDRGLIDSLALDMVDVPTIITTDDASLFPEVCGRVYVGAMELDEAYQMARLELPATRSHLARRAAEAFRSHPLTLKLACDLGRRNEVLLLKAMKRHEVDPLAVVRDMAPQITFRPIFRDTLALRAPIGTHRRQIFEIVTLLHPTPVPLAVLKLMVRVVVNNSPRVDLWCDEMTERAVSLLADACLIETAGLVVSQNPIVFESLVHNVGPRSAALAPMLHSSVFLLGQELLRREAALQNMDADFSLFTWEAAEIELFAILDQLAFSVSHWMAEKPAESLDELYLRFFVQNLDIIVERGGIDHSRAIEMVELRAEAGIDAARSYKDDEIRAETLLFDDADDWDSSEWTEYIDAESARLSRFDLNRLLSASAVLRAVLDRVAG